MAKPNALYAAGLTSLAFLCFAIASTAVAVPVWGHFENPSGGWDTDRGYFGPWKVCKTLNYYREKCGIDVSSFKPSKLVYISGILASVSTTALGFFCVLCILQIAMISAREQVVIKYRHLLILKMILALIACLLAIAAAVIFAYQIDDSSRSGFSVVRGISFYIQIVVIILTTGLVVFALYDILFSKRSVDATMAVNTSPATTYNNPGFRERRKKNGISVTDASGKPYRSTTNGSIASVNTTLTSVSNGSTIESVTRSPLRSSLKKTKVQSDPLGIQNQGFSTSGHSPQMNRNGSMKKVRIHTLSTEV